MLAFRFPVSFTNAPNGAPPACNAAFTNTNRYTPIRSVEKKPKGRERREA